MKKITRIFLLFALICFTGSSYYAYGVPANNKATTVTMPDGSRLTVHLYGDEYGHYTATSDGYEVIRKQDGFFYYAVLQGDEAVATDVVAKEAGLRGAKDRAILAEVSRPGANNGMRISAMRDAKTAAAATMQTPPVMQSSGVSGPGNTRAGEKFKSLVILVNFKDVSFTTPNPRTAVSNLLNKEGYSENGAVGSARDYYYDNSNGRFDAQFDVVGPYTLSQNMSYYGGNDDENAYLMAVEACQQAAADVNYGDYLNAQGRVQDVYIFYAGYAESYSGNDPDTVWPHRWANRLYSYGLSLQGKRFTGYACSSELWGWKHNSDHGFTTIGTFCHEFGHVLGWPDFYDADGLSNGSAVTPADYSLMAGGCYNANGAKPSALLAIERKLQGWLEGEVTLTESGSYELPDIYTTDKAYIIETGNSGEYYLLESKSSRNNKWDNGFKDQFKDHIEGLLVTHVDRSGSYLSRWNNNQVNNYSAHPCLRIVKANNNTSSGIASQIGWIFPQNGVTGLSGKTHREFIPWSGSSLGKSIRSISYSNGKTSFSFGSENPAVSLKISDSEISVSAGRQHTIIATVMPPDAYNADVVWSSNNAQVATVADGVVTGVASGQADITAKTSDGSLSAVCHVTVINEISDIRVVTAYQNDAELSWNNATHQGAFKLELYRGDEMLKEWTTEGKYAYISLLKPSTSYILKITAVYADGSEGSVMSRNFNTQATIQAYSSILVKGYYNMSENVPLRVLHTSPSLKSLVWKVDGTEVLPPAVKLSSGRHELTVTVTNDDGYVEKITKYITVN